MDSSTVVIVAIVVAVFLAFLMVVTTARRRDQGRAIGRLSKETIERDRSEQEAAPVLGALESARRTGREVERLATLERVEGERLPAMATEAPPPMLPAMDPETLGVTRRQVLNRGIVIAMGAGLTAFGASLVAFLWPQLAGGFGSKIKAGTVDEILAQIRDKRTP